MTDSESETAASLPDGQYVDAKSRPVVVLVRPDQPIDYSQVKGVVQQGEVIWFPKKLPNMILKPGV